MIEIRVLRDEVLGVDVMRGFARLCDLAKISRADVFDEKSNPTGTQRDLSPKHAREAYEYARTTELGYWPEVFLCARDASVIEFTPDQDGQCGTLKIFDDAIIDSDRISISRVDGNHRLHLADGKTEGVPPITRKASFCMAVGLNIVEEIAIFRDINNNQKRMDTSHLDKIELRLSPADIIKAREPDLYIASKLADEPDSPLAGFVYQGGKRPPGTFIPLRTLRTGIEYMLSRQTKLTAVGDRDAQYVLIKNYFDALRIWVPEAWANPKDYLLLRGAGLWGVCFLGAEIVDRALAKQEFTPGAMLAILESGRRWDWSRGGDFQGYSGRGGSTRIADSIIRELRGDDGVSMNRLISDIIRSGRT
ncbi:MAG: DGQHR domain-containing protein [Brevundimonas sp.]|nr:DGQHR domain-containing protein [Brevundimonas sp.]